MALGTIHKSADYSRITLPSTSCSGHINKKTAPAAIKKRGKTVHFHGTTEEVNRITACDTPIPIKKRGEVQAKKLKSD